MVIPDGEFMLLKYCRESIYFITIFWCYESTYKNIIVVKILAIHLMINASMKELTRHYIIISSNCNLWSLMNQLKRKRTFRFTVFLNNILLVHFCNINFCWCICNSGMYSSMYLMYCNLMFITGCIYNVIESCCHAPMFWLRGSIM